MSDLIEERTGVKPGTSGAVFKLNPRVDDIIDRFAVQHEGIRLLKMGVIKVGGTGCYCPENAFLKNFVSHLFLGEHDVLIMDMEAGVEHLGRGTARGVDWLLIVVEPSRQSFDTAKRIQTLAGEIGLTHIGVVGNKCRNEQEIELLMRSVAPLPLLGVLPYDDGLRMAEVEGRPPDTRQPVIQREITRILHQLVV